MSQPMYEQSKAGVAQFVPQWYAAAAVPQAKEYREPSLDVSMLVMLKDGQRLPMAHVRRFNPNSHGRFHPLQLFPLWHYFLQDGSGLTLVETYKEVHFYHTESRPRFYPRRPTTEEVQILDMQTRKYLVEQAIVHHGQLMDRCKQVELTRSKTNVKKLAAECDVLFIRNAYQRILKMGLDPKSITLRAFEAHKKWLGRVPMTMQPPSKGPKKRKLGKAASKKRGDSFSVDDWQCNKCGHINWTGSHQCDMCNTPKFGEVEERKGYSGEHDDRINVEYIEIQDSDEECDEFGRTKRKYRGKNDGSPIRKKDIKTPEVSVKRPEVEDDDDTVDLSKYDVSDWGFSGDVTADQDKEKSPSRFRSKSPDSSRSSNSRRKSRYSSHSPASRSDRRGKRSRSRSSSKSDDSLEHWKNISGYFMRNKRSRSRSTSKDRQVAI